MCSQALYALKFCFLCYLPPADEGRGREIIKRLPYVRVSVRPSVRHIFT